MKPDLLGSLLLGRLAPATRVLLHGGLSVVELLNWLYQLLDHLVDVEHWFVTCNH